MKKIFTLTVGLFLTIAMFAADRRPLVTVTSTKKYQIVIDGRQYTANGNSISISTLFSGQHDIKVYALKRGSFTGFKKLVASSDFQVRNNDVQITISRLGQIQVTESRIGHDGGHDYGKGNNSHNHDKRF